MNPKLMKALRVKRLMHQTGDGLPDDSSGRPGHEASTAMVGRQRTRLPAWAVALVGAAVAFAGVGTAAVQAAAARADLVPLSASLSVSRATPGGELSISVSVRNQGQVTAFGVFALVLLSTDSTIARTDTWLAEVPIGDLPAQVDATTQALATVPGSVAPGAYYVGMIVDTEQPVSETNVVNNTSNLSNVQPQLQVVADTDADGDGVGDALDNCPQEANGDQRDRDDDGVGDACDNCVGSANGDQADGDTDGAGDVCDNCPSLPNPEQADADTNGAGDACDPGDRDQDGTRDVEDNCPDVPNPDQADADTNGVGDACDSGPTVRDRDADGVVDGADNCPGVPNADQADADTNGVGDACESGPANRDHDGDGIGDTIDNCPGIVNADQRDTDGDGTGDACERGRPDDGGAGLCGAGTAATGAALLVVLAAVKLCGPDPRRRRR